MKNATIKTLEIQLSRVAGVSVEITIRGERKFTYSFDGDNESAVSALKNYFGTQGVFSSDSGYDHECDHTCLYHNL